MEVSCIFKSTEVYASSSSDDFWRYGLVIDGCHLFLEQWLWFYIISPQNKEEKFIVFQRAEMANVKK